MGLPCHARIVVRADSLEDLMIAKPMGSSFNSVSDLASGTAWRRSSRCDINGSCVEVARLADGDVGVRDGKIGAASPVLAFGQQSWRNFVSAMAAGYFDAS
jgi:Domain of unknown function (DUF397)